MTSLTTAPPPGSAVPPESARRVKSASGGADRVFGRPLRDASLLVLLLLEALPRAVGTTSLHGNGQWTWRNHVADEVAATTTRLYQRHLGAQLKWDALVKRVAKTAGSPPVQVIDR